MKRLHFLMFVLLAGCTTTKPQIEFTKNILQYPPEQRCIELTGQAARQVFLDSNTDVKSCVYEKINQECADEGMLDWVLKNYEQDGIDEFVYEYYIKPCNK